MNKEGNFLKKFITILTEKKQNAPLKKICLGYRIQDSEYRIQKTWYRIQDTEYIIYIPYDIENKKNMTLNTQYRIHSTGCRILDTEYRNTEYKIQRVGYRILDKNTEIQNPTHKKC